MNSVNVIEVITVPIKEKNLADEVAVEVAPPVKPKGSKT
jgi:hypothetical protein